MLELLAKGGMRIGEVLKIRPIDVKDRKITLPDPKTGRDGFRNRVHPSENCRPIKGLNQG